MHITSLYYLGTRFNEILKEPIKEKLKVIKKQFDKISKKIIIENEVRIIQGILDLIKVVLKFPSNQEQDIFISENEQSIIVGDQQFAKTNMYTQVIEKQYFIALMQYQLAKYQAPVTRQKDDITCFEAFQRMQTLKVHVNDNQQNVLENVCILDKTR